MTLCPSVLDYILQTFADETATHNGSYYGQGCRRSNYYSSPRSVFTVQFAQFAVFADFFAWGRTGSARVFLRLRLYTWVSCGRRWVYLCLLLRVSMPGDCCFSVVDAS